MDLSDLAGSSGWLASLLGGGSSPGQPTSLAAPGMPQPTLDSAGLPVNGQTAGQPSGGPTLNGALTALGQAGPGVQKAIARPAVPAPQIMFPQPRGNPTATALAQVMQRMKQPSI